MRNEPNKEDAGIEVVAKVHFGGAKSQEEIKAVIIPDAMTLLSQVEALTTRTSACARAMMFQKVADRFNSIAKAGNYPEDAPEVIQAHVSFIVGNGIVASMQGVAIDFANPCNIAETLPFEQDEVEQAEKELVMYLLSTFVYGKEVLS